MSEISTPTFRRNLLVIVGYGSADSVQEWEEFANALSKHLGVPVQPAFVDTATPSVGEGIRKGVATNRPQKVIVLPMFLGASAAKKNNVISIVNAAKDLWTDVIVHYGKPLGTPMGIISAYSQLITAALRTAPTEIDISDMALLVVGRGSRDPESNAEIYHMARLFWEEFRFGSLETAFYGSTSPDIAAGVKRCIQAGAKRIVVVPYLLYEKPLYRAIQAQVQQIQAMYPAELMMVAHLGIHNGMIEAVSQRYQEALAELATTLCDFCPFSEDEDNKLRLLFSHSHGAGSTHTHNFAGLANDVQALLPSRYQGDVAVSAAPMGAADLKFDAEGKVAWNEIWGDFCDLALAGGPPHRGTLLEPVSPESVVADPEGYKRVLGELERGIRMVTKLPVVASKSPGWIGMECDSEEMALWLLRAIIVENISVRREDSILYFPAGPDFRLEKEIKNVVTVIAKTHHYWTEHLSSQSKADN